MFFWFGLERTGFRRIYIDSNKPEWFFFISLKRKPQKSPQKVRERKRVKIMGRHGTENCGGGGGN